MTKQRKPEPLDAVLAAVDHSLDMIGFNRAVIDRLTANFNEEVSRLKAKYDQEFAPIKSDLVRDEKILLALMAVNKAVLFDGTDIVRLSNGSLIHSVADKVSIPRDALARCKELGFAEVVKIAESLDREAVEKWPDERLILIGAERKQKEEFSYDLKEVKA